MSLSMMTIALTEDDHNNANDAEGNDDGSDDDEDDGGKPLARSYQLAASSEYDVTSA